MTTRLLVSPPSPSAPDGAERRRQWDRFVELAACAADVELVTVETAGAGDDLVFTANAALTCGRLAIVASFRSAERRREQPVYRAALARAGFATTYLQQTYFEGAGDALYDRVRPALYAGYGRRSERSATLQLQEIVGCRVVPLLLADERFAHLDSALCPLGTGHVLAYLDAFSPHAQQLLRRTIAPDHLIPVSIDDALAYACNALELGDALLLDDCSRALRERLQAIGYRLFQTDLGAFRRAGGGARSLVLRLDDGPARQAEAAAS